MRPDQIEALEIMLDDYGVEGVLEALADALGRKASWLRCTPLATEHGPAVKRYMLQAEALRAQASALAAGRALTYATQNGINQDLAEYLEMQEARKKR